jgi:hypothetical protein
MRLLRLTNNKEFSLTDDLSDDDIPKRYAILSHTWIHGEEVTFQELIDGTGKGKSGYKKIQFCGAQAAHDGLDYFWVDTCCINKLDPTELTTAINSMFRWYQNAERCYVYLSDVSVRTQDGKCVHVEWMSSFRNSQWFRRGWTLQELLASKVVDFYSLDGVRLGDKIALEQQIAEITRIPVEALRGQPLAQFGIEERFSWVEGRQTTKQEDKAYCLLGIFGVVLSLIYGEGKSSAMRRLRKEIMSNEPQSTSTAS